jgi:hypothetical protein
MMGGQGLHVVRHAGRGGDLGMVGPGGGEALVEHPLVEEMPLVGKLAAEALAHDHEALMRPEGLVGAEQIDVAAQRAHVGEAMGRIAHAVDAGSRAGRMGHGSDPGHVVDLGQDVRAMREADEPDGAIL